jgi:hypothetical protein
MNELELIARLRDEVPLDASDAIEQSVLATIRASDGAPRTGVGRARRARRGSSGLGSRWLRPRPVLASVLALAICAGAGIGVVVSRHPARPPQPQTQAIAWTGRPMAPWQVTGQPSFGRARTEAQLIAYVTRAAAAAPKTAPKPHEWVAVKIESAQSSGGGGGYMFGPPDERQVTLQWFRVDGCAQTSPIMVSPSLPPTKTVSGTLTLEQASCDQSDQAGWKSYGYQYLNSLPTDPAALESVILANNPPGQYLPTRTDRIFSAIYNLLANSEPIGAVIPPKLSAALYQVLRDLPGVHFENDTDLAGRSGLGFYAVLEGYDKEELVIDPVTYAYMGYKDVAIRDHTDTGTDGTWHVEKGHVLGWEALLGSAVVQHPGQLP